MKAEGGNLEDRDKYEGMHNKFVRDLAEIRTKFKALGTFGNPIKWAKGYYIF